MKALILAAMSALTLQAHALDQPAVSIPAQLTCTEILNVFGTEQLATEVLNLSEEVVFQSPENDRFAVDFSDGDQTETYDFKREEIAALIDGKAETVRGLRTQGFFFSDGDHTESLTVVECKL